MMLRSPGGAMEPPPRVLMTVDAVGGVWTYGMHLAASLASRGVQFLIACLGPAPSKCQAAEAAALPNVVLKHGDYALEWMDDPWDSVDASGEWLLELAEEFQPDIVHLNGYAHASLPWGCPCVIVAHSCVASWWRAVKHEELPARYAEYRSRVAAGLRTADLIISPTGAMLAALKSEYGILSANQVIWNGVPPGSSPSRAKKPHIFSAGRLWDEAKNVALFHKISDHLTWPVRLAGDRHGSDLASSNIEALGLLPRCALLDEFGSASIYAAPALYEPFGLAILEAARAHCALVLSDIPSLHELWGGAAVFVNPNDPESWMETLNRLADDETQREALAAAAHHRSRAYGVAAMGDLYLKSYADLMTTSAMPHVLT